MSVTVRRVARKRHPACGGYCPSILPGEVYLEHTAFPGDGDLNNERFWRIRECAACATRYGRASLLSDPAGSVQDVHTDTGRNC